MSKTHKLKTIQDIVDVVDKDNLKNFIIDLEMWLAIEIQSRPLRPLMKMKTDEFDWIEDGKHDPHIEIRVEDEKEKSNK